MAKIGDRIIVTIFGPNVLDGTASTATSSTAIGAGQSLTATGRITEDLGDNWRIQLDYPLLGTEHMVIPKDRVR